MSRNRVETAAESYSAAAHSTGKAVRSKLHELNDEDYETFVDVIEQAASKKEHIDKNDRRETVLYRLDEAIKHKGWTVTRDGNVQPIEYEE